MPPPLLKIRYANRIREVTYSVVAKEIVGED